MEPGAIVQKILQVSTPVITSRFHPCLTEAEVLACKELRAWGNSIQEGMYGVGVHIHT